MSLSVKLKTTSPSACQDPVCGNSTVVRHPDSPVLFVSFLSLLGLLLLLLTVSKVSSAQDGYHDYDDMVTQINVWELEAGEIVTVSNLSEDYDLETTAEGRNLWLVTVSDEDEVNRKGEPESQVLFLGGLEGRNWMSVEVCMAFLDHIIQGYESDPRLQNLVADNEIFVIPMVNPDGSQYSRENDDPGEEGVNGWIKNRNGTDGVNINRNFDILWNRDLESGINDTSGDPLDFSYAGEDPGSEVESQSLMTLVQEKDLNFILLFDALGKSISTIPFAKDEAPFAKDESDLMNSEDQETLDRLSGYVASFLDYNELRENPYIICGDFLDWCYNEDRLLSLKIGVGESYIPLENELEDLNVPYTEMCLNAVELSYYFENFSFMDSMEGEEDWENFSSPEGTWHLLEDRARAYDGKACWAIDGFQNDSTGSLETGKFINLEGSENPKFSFFHNYQLELVDAGEREPNPNHDAGDGGFLEVKVLGEDFVLIYPETGYPYRFAGNHTNSQLQSHWAFAGDSDGWQQVVFDLSPYKGQQIKIRFRFSANDQNSSGWWLLDHLFIYDGDELRTNFSAEVVNDGDLLFPGELIQLNFSLVNIGHQPDLYSFSGALLQGNENGKLNFSLTRNEIQLAPGEEAWTTAYLGATEDSLEGGDINLSVEVLSDATGWIKTVYLTAIFGETYEISFFPVERVRTMPVGSDLEADFWLNSSSNVPIIVLLDCSEIPKNWELLFQGETYTGTEFKDISLDLEAKEELKDLFTLKAPDFEIAGTRAALVFSAEIDEHGIIEIAYLNATIEETHSLGFLLESSYLVVPGEEDIIWITVKNTGNAKDDFVLELIGSPQWGGDFKFSSDSQFSLDPQGEKEIALRFEAPGETPFQEKRSQGIRGKIMDGDTVLFSQDETIFLEADVSAVVDVIYENGALEMLPGQPTSLVLRIHNQGNLEEEFLLKIEIPNNWVATSPATETPVTIDAFSSEQVTVQVTVAEATYGDIFILEFRAESTDGTVTDKEPEEVPVRIGAQVNFAITDETDMGKREVVLEEEFNFRFTIENDGNGQMTFYVNETSIPTGWSILDSSQEFKIGKNADRTVTISLSHDPGEVRKDEDYQFEFRIEALGEGTNFPFTVTVLPKEGDETTANGESDGNLGLMIGLLLLAGVGIVGFYFYRERIGAGPGDEEEIAPLPQPVSLGSESQKEEGKKEGEGEDNEENEGKKQDDDTPMKSQEDGGEETPGKETSGEEAPGEDEKTEDDDEERSSSEEEEEEEAGTQEKEEDEDFIPPTPKPEEEEDEDFIPPTPEPEKEEDEDFIPPTPKPEEEEDEDFIPPTPESGEEEDEDFIPPTPEPEEEEDEDFIPPTPKPREDDDEDFIPPTPKPEEEEDEDFIPPTPKPEEEEDEDFIPPTPEPEEEEDEDFIPPTPEPEEEEDEDFIPPTPGDPDSTPKPESEPKEEDDPGEDLSTFPEKRECPKCGRTLYVRDFSRETKCLWCGTYVRFKKKMT